MGSASGGMRIVHVNAIRWAGSLRWDRNDRHTHAQATSASKQFSVLTESISIMADKIKSLSLIPMRQSERK